MTMAVVEALACDACATVPATSFRVTTDGQEYVVDLCEKCAKPLTVAMAAGRIEKPKRVVRRFEKTTEYRINP
jgi:RNase P subunit RPR2